MSKIKIVSDSTADIPKYLQEELNITVLPLTIISGDKEYADGVDITTEEFYEMLESSDKLPSTSRTTPRLFFETCEKIMAEGYTDLIYVCLNSKGSSTYQGAVLESEDFYDEHPEAKGKFNIHVIDSLTYSMVYGAAAVDAARAAKEGKSIDEVLSIIRDWLDNAKVLAVPMTLKYAKKSGRISAASAFVGEALGLKPVITFVDGESQVIGKIRGEKKVIPELIKLINSNRAEGTPYYVAGGNNPELTEKLRDACREEFGHNEELTFLLGGIITINIGPNTIGIIYRGK